MLVGPVIIVAEDAVLLHLGVQEEVVLVPGHPVIHQELVHLAVDPAAVVEIQAEEAAGVEDFGRADRRRTVGVKILRGFALDENGIRPPLQDFLHRQNIGPDDMLEGGDKTPVRPQLLVPPSVFRGEDGADEHFVHRRVELHPGEAFGEGGSIGREEVREVRVLEIADPVGNAEMAEVDDRRNIAPLQIVHCQVGEFPVVPARGEKCLVKRRPEAKEGNAEILDAVEVLAPAAIMIARLHLVDARLAVVDRGDAVFDPCREHEIGYCRLSSISPRMEVRRSPRCRRRLRTAHRLMAGGQVRFPASRGVPK